MSDELKALAEQGVGLLTEIMEWCKDQLEAGNLTPQQESEVRLMAATIANERIRSAKAVPCSGGGLGE